MTRGQGVAQQHGHSTWADGFDIGHCVVESQHCFMHCLQHYTTTLYTNLHKAEWQSAGSQTGLSLWTLFSNHEEQKRVAARTTQKSCIRQILNLLTFADTSTDTKKLKKETKTIGHVLPVTCHLSPVTYLLSLTSNIWSGITRMDIPIQICL